MRRRVVMSLVLLGIVGGSASAFADNDPQRRPMHELCIVTSSDPDHSTTQDYCVNWPGPVS